MKHLFKIGALLTGLFTSGLSTHAQVKIPHSHHSEQKGQVVMLGDDHIELTAKKPTQLVLHLTDKFRAPLPLSAVKLTAIINLNGEEKPLTVVPSKQMPNMATIDFDSKQIMYGILHLQVTRLKVPKGHLVSNAPQLLPLRILFQ